MASMSQGWPPKWTGTIALVCGVHFRAASDEVDVGIHFYQWWLLEASYLYADDARLERVGDDAGPHDASSPPG